MLGYVDKSFSLIIKYMLSGGEIGMPFSFLCNTTFGKVLLQKKLTSFCHFFNVEDMKCISIRAAVFAVDC